MDLTDTAAIFIRAVMIPLATLLPLINPPGTVPLFLSMTPGASDAVRALVARRVARNSFALLVAAMLVGSGFLMVFGLSLAAIKIAGGLFVMMTASHLLRSDQSPDSELAAASPALPAEKIAAHGFHPLTFPITIGPGSISVAMTLGAGVRVREASDVTKMLGVVVGIVVVSVSIYLCYRFASRMVRLLGHTGSAVLTRLSAFVLLAVGVQILCDGISERFGLAVSPR